MGERRTLHISRWASANEKNFWWNLADVDIRCMFVVTARLFIFALALAMSMDVHHEFCVIFSFDCISLNLNGSRKMFIEFELSKFNAEHHQKLFK